MPKTELSHPLGCLGRFLEAFGEVLGGLGNQLGLHLGCVFKFLDCFLEVLFDGAFRLDFLNVF